MLTKTIKDSRNIGVGSKNIIQSQTQ